MENKFTIVGISGSLRKGSYNTMLLHALTDLLPDGVQLKIISFADLPVYNEDDDLPTVSSRPAAVNKFREELAKADGLLIVSPEYNYSIPGGLKNAIDWASRGNDSPLFHMPVSLMGASQGMWGTVRMQMAFLPVLLTLRMKPVGKPEVLVAQAQTKFDAQGKLTDEMTKDTIRKNLLRLKELMESKGKA